MSQHSHYMRAIWTALCLAVAVPVFAQSTPGPTPNTVTFGVRAGLSADPNQFFIGAHVESPRIGVTQHMALRPSVEIGLGGDAGTSALIDFGVISYLPFANSPWSVYVGGGPAVLFRHGTDTVLDTGNTTSGGATLVVGLQNRSGIFFEAKAAGGGAGAAIKGTVGYVFSPR